MSIISTTRRASIEEITAEMDRRGHVIEALEAEATRLRTALRGMIEAVDGMSGRNTQSEVRVLRKAYIAACAAEARSTLSQATGTEGGEVNSNHTPSPRCPWRICK